MINKRNWKLTRSYLEYRLKVDQISEGSLAKEETHIRFLLEWAGEKPFDKAASIRPAFPEYIQSSRLDGSQGRLSSEYLKKILASSRRFFKWLIDNQTGTKKIRQAWVNTLKTKRILDAPKTKEAVSLEEILAIARAPVSSMVERRIQAAAVFLFLSGMRIGAFVSLPIKAVDLENRTITQFPTLGVKTKNGKFGITTLLDIPELLNVVQIWDKEVREKLTQDGYWFAPFSPDTGTIDPYCLEIGEHRETLARKNLRDWLVKVGLPYHSPHKFRHGHVHFGLAHARTIEDYKAISLNVMHSSMEITDQFYSNLNDDQVHQRISSIGKNDNSTVENQSNNEKLFQQFLEFKKWMEKQGFES